MTAPADQACDRWARECVVEPTLTERLSFKMGWLAARAEIAERLGMAQIKAPDPYDGVIILDVPKPSDRVNPIRSYVDVGSLSPALP